MTEADNENRKRAEEALRESEERLDFVLKGSQLGFWDWNLETNEVKRNERWAEMLGYKLHEIEFTVKQWLHFIHPDDRAIADQSIQDHLAGRTPMHQVEYRMLAKDGHCVWILDQARVVKRDHLGRPLRMSGTHTDITKRKQTEEELLREKQFMKTLLDSLPGIFYLYSYPELRLVNWNKNHEMLLGFDPGEIKDRSVLDFHLPEAKEAVLDAVEMVMEKGHDMIESPLLTKDGRLVPFILTGDRLEVSGRKYLMGVGIDITERKLAEEALQRNEARQRAMVASIADVIAIVDPDGINRYKSPNIEKWFGWRPEEVVGVSTWENVHPGDLDRTRQFFGALLGEPGAAGTAECRYRCKDGSYKWIELTAVNLVHDPEIQGILVNYHDISKRRRAEEELLHINQTLEHRVALAVEKNMAQERMLIRQNRLAGMGEMVGNIAHQWRQPLNALGLLLFNIKDAYQFNTLDAAYLDQAVADGNRLVQKMSTTISDFSNFFRPDKEKRAFSALGQIREAIVLVESSFQNSNISVHIHAPHDMMLLGFPNEYSQVLLNLLSNAKEAILARNQPQSSGFGRVDMVLSEHNGQAIVTVADNGGGIPAEILDRIFDPYFSTKKKGSGIGLYMSKMIIERNMNGSIMAKNIDGGAEFIVASPLVAGKG